MRTREAVYAPSDLRGCYPLLMAQEICTYCLQPMDAKGAGTDLAATDDHVIPGSWYPEGTRNDQMPQVPACRKCNNEMSALEEAVKFPLVMSAGQTPATRGVIESTLRSIQPESGKNQRDAEIRARKALAVQRRFRFDDEGDPAFVVKAEERRRILEKFSRGFYRYERKELLPRDLSIGAGLADLKEEAQAALLSAAQVRTIAPGFWYALLVDPNEPRTSACFVHLMGSVLYLALTRPRPRFPIPKPTRSRRGRPRG